MVQVTTEGLTTVHADEVWNSEGRSGMAYQHSVNRRTRPAKPAADYGVDSVADVIADTFGLEGARRGTEMDISCPNPGHDDRRASCGVNLDTGYWHCFSCGVGGDIAELGALVLGRPADEVAAMFAPRTAEALLTVLQRRVARLVAPARARAVPVALPTHDDPAPRGALRDRDMPDEVLDYWGVRWVPEHTMVGNNGPYTIRSSLAIPIRDETGKLLAWCYRATAESPSWQPRYLYTPGVNISELWFGLNKHAHAEAITVVEGGIDAMWTTFCGHPALGLLGSQMGTRKIMMLPQRYRTAMLLGDLDKAGVRWVARVGSMIGTIMPVTIGQYRPWMLSKRPDKFGVYHRASDPEELRPVDLEIVHATAVPYSSWAMTRRAG